MIDRVEVRQYVLGGNCSTQTHSQDVGVEASSVKRLSRIWASEHPTDIHPHTDVTLDQVHSWPEMSLEVTKLGFVNATPRQSGSEKSECPRKYAFASFQFNCSTWCRNLPSLHGTCTFLCATEHIYSPCTVTRYTMCPACVMVHCVAKTSHISHILSRLYLLVSSSLFPLLF